MKDKKIGWRVLVLLLTAVGAVELSVFSGCSSSKNTGNPVVKAGKSGSSDSGGGGATASGDHGNSNTNITPSGGDGDSGGGSGGGGSGGGGGNGDGSEPPPPPAYYNYAFVKMETANNKTVTNILWADTKGTTPKALTAFTSNNGIVMPILSLMAFTPDASKLFYMANVNQGLTSAVLDVQAAQTTPPTAPTAWATTANSLSLFAAPLADGTHVLTAVYDGATWGCTLKKADLSGTNLVIERDPGVTCQNNNPPSNCAPNEFYFGLSASQVTKTSDPAYSALIFAVGKSQNPDKSIDLWINLLGGSKDEAFNLTKNNNIGEMDPSLSPDGKKLAFTAVKVDPNNQQQSIYRVKVCDLAIPDRTDLTQSKLENCKETSGMALSPTWSCDGRKIFYAVPSGDPYQIGQVKGQVYWMNADTTNAVALTDASTNAWLPTGSPKCPQ